MPDEFDFISITDKPALVAVSKPTWLQAVRNALGELGYKVHVTNSHEDFLQRFAYAQYQVVIIEELFETNSAADNRALSSVQKMTMNQRRHATIILIGDSFPTLGSFPAFQQSVQAVVNSAEFPLLSQIILKVVADNDLFLRTYHEVQSRTFLEKL